MPINIAILGWGSLLWDKRPEFDEHHGDWELDGPVLKIEFSRISQTRDGALTLVVDPENGAACRVAHSRSKRKDPEDAICDLQSREGTTRANIGFHFLDGSRSQYKDQATLASIKEWAISKSIDLVVWTDLSSNFEKQLHSQFSVESALAHLQSLDAKAKARAAEYVWQAPDFVATPLRTAVQAVPWFK
ncbi:hypothetical protein Meth11DRAFT_1393 [Methylophilaceae bacterium 11]|nr:hypothetical protein Meth11DRAFT_1393 [Methylophilaceae bacterium 11]